MQGDRRLRVGLAQRVGLPPEVVRTEHRPTQFEPGSSILGSLEGHRRGDPPVVARLVFSSGSVGQWFQWLTRSQSQTRPTDRIGGE
jgi:hypothetical protein